MRAGKSTLSPNLAGMASATATDAHTVVIKMSAPNPDLPIALSQEFGAGLVANPTALSTPKALDLATNGTGPYKLDPSQTVSGDHYTYVKNPDYWNPSAVHYSSVVVKVASDANSVVSAISAGQINIAVGRPDTAKTAQGAGATVASAPGSVTALYLLDRNGKLVPALANQQVRQAINYAIDRTGITKALNPAGYADPTSQMGIPLQNGFQSSLDSYYSYDVNKAKDLLSQAGYANGFSFTAMCSTILGTCPLAQAVASSLAKVGITMKIDQESEISSFNQKYSTGAVPAVFFTSGSPTYMAAHSLVGTGVLANAFNTTDPTIAADYKKVASTTGQQQADASATFQKDLANLAWFAPVYRRYSLVYADGVSNVKLQPANPSYYSVVDPNGTNSWKPGS